MAYWHTQIGWVLILILGGMLIGSDEPAVLAIALDAAIRNSDAGGS